MILLLRKTNFGCELLKKIFAENKTGCNQTIRHVDVRMLLNKAKSQQCYSIFFILEFIRKSSLFYRHITTSSYD